MHLSGISTCLESKCNVEGLRVANNAAERGVQLCLDFISLSKTENPIQNVLQVVENCRGGNQTSSNAKRN